MKSVSMIDGHIDGEAYENTNLKRFVVQIVVSAQNEEVIKDWLRQAIGVYIKECEINVVK